MSLRFWRHPQSTARVLPPPRPDDLAIAVLEYDEFGVQPEPGTAAALVIGLRLAAAATCWHFNVADVSTLAQPSTGLCRGCGSHMLQASDGRWRIA